MTTVWDQTQAGQPHTHVLLLGVGTYRHIRGGTDYKAELPVSNLRQLTSPPISARKFADWLLKELHNPDAPLGSVELLLSEQPQAPYKLPDGEEIPIDQATMSNIKTAFSRWYEHCNSHEDNIAIFYFCGHGVMVGGDRILLVEDYGANSLKPFETAIHFERMLRGMAQCKARCQCYFIDACSEVSIDLLKIEETGAEFFIQSNLLKPSNKALVLGASAPGDSAYAPPGQMSRFTDALLQCLDGLSSELNQGKWVVTTDTLIGRVIRVVNQLNSQSRGEYKQQPSYSGSVAPRQIHVREKPPLVPITIRFDPRLAIGEARLALQSRRDRSWHREREPAVLDWELDLPVEAGQYDLSVRFPSGRYQEINEVLWVMPPGPWPAPDPIPCKENQ